MESIDELAVKLKRDVGRWEEKMDCTPMIGQIELGEPGVVSCYPPD